jgi:hypothetical protein
MPVVVPYTRDLVMYVPKDVGPGVENNETSNP